jgi:hypothetical protein
MPVLAYNSYGTHMLRQIKSPEKKKARNDSIEHQETLEFGYQSQSDSVPLTKNTLVQTMFIDRKHGSHIIISI